MRYFLIGACAAVAVGVLADRCHAEVVTGIQTSAISYTESDVQQTFGLKATVGMSTMPVYLFGSYEAPTIRLDGQPMGDADILGIGIGTQTAVTNDISLFVEAGYGFINLSTNDNVVSEVVYTHMRQAHYYPDRYQPGDTSISGATYELDDAFVGRVGATWRVTKHIGITASYRYMDATETMNQWDGDEPPTLECGCWWQSDESMNLSGFEIGATVKW